MLNFQRLQSIVFEDQVAIRLDMDGCPHSMAAADLGKDPSLVVDVVVSYSGYATDWDVVQ